MSHNSDVELSRVRFVSAHYELMQGIVVVPGLLVVAFLVFAGTPAGEGLDTPGWFAGVIAAGLLATLLAWRVNRRFVREYGEAGPPRRQGWGMILATLLTSVPVAVLHRMDLDVWFSPEASVVSAALLGAALRLRPVALPLGLAGVLGMVAALLPLASMLDVAQHPLSRVEYLLTALCLAGAVVALWSQLLLRRMMRRSE